MKLGSFVVGSTAPRANTCRDSAAADGRSDLKTQANFKGTSTCFVATNKNLQLQMVDQI